MTNLIIINDPDEEINMLDIELIDVVRDKRRKNDQFRNSYNIPIIIEEFNRSANSSSDKEFLG